jgi:hypothetical protein
VLPQRPSVAFFAGAEINTRNYAALNSLTISCSVFFASPKIMVVLSLKNSGSSNVGKAGWSWGCVATVDFNGRTIFVADAHRDDGKRFIVHADENLTAFLELESTLRTVTS